MNYCKLLLIVLLGVQAFRQSQHGAGEGPIFLDLLTCDGIETDISQCRVRYEHSCTHGDDASVQCIGKVKY